MTYRESWEGDDRQLYIVMGFCEGGDLYHRLKQRKGELLPERQVVEWFVQIAMALQVHFIFILSTSTIRNSGKWSVKSLKCDFCFSVSA